MKAKERSTALFLAGLLCGALAGAAAGLLLAPREGKATRWMVRDRAIDERDTARDMGMGESRGQASAGDIHAGGRPPPAPLASP